MEVKAAPFIIAAAVRWLSPSVAVQRLTEAQTAAAAPACGFVHTANLFHFDKNLLWLSCRTVLLHLNLFYFIFAKF